MPSTLGKDKYISFYSQIRTTEGASDIKKMTAVAMLRINVGST